MSFRPPTSGSRSRATRRQRRLAFLKLPVRVGIFFLALITSAGQLNGQTNAQARRSLDFFESRIRPLLVEHCYECHADGEASGGLKLDSRAGWMRGGDSGAALIPGDPENSLLMAAVNQDARELQMPPQNPLPPADVAAIRRWIEEGAVDPRRGDDSAVAPTGMSPTGMSIEEGTNFWSFRPVADPVVPHVENQAWVKTPIDAFVLSRLEENGLSPAPPADRRTLIRRIAFDLVGMPPTPEEIQSFLADQSPDAVNRLVERFLQSPDYGVRWGRHWLDVARYADSNGLDENLAFGNAWRYRDYVVDAFNDDLPFDRFLIEQMAGDLLPDASNQTRIATGFLLLGAKVLAEPDREKLLMDTIDEQIDTTGKVFLGMTLGCARCHDHKFDPIKQSDYYSLAAVFRSTRTFADTSTGAIKHWHQHVFANEEELQALKQVDDEIAAKKKAATTFKNQAMEKIRTAARSKATEYLVAAASFDPDEPLNRVEQYARPLGLHPRILHHCRLHLKYHADDPFFTKWHQLKRDHENDLAAAIDRHYRPLFEDAEAALAEARKQDPPRQKLSDANLEAVRAALYDKSGFLAVPPKPEFAFDPETLAKYNALMDEARIFESRAPDVPAAMGVADGEVLASLPIHVRGSHLSLGDPVQRSFPAVMRASHPQPTLPPDQSGRLQLAKWMASPEHPLTARVQVNRIWRWHFGEGLVRTTENFGVLGDRPSHPLLLDWLTRRFVQSGWSVKELHRLILASNVYQMDSQHSGSRDSRSPEGSVDPENRLLWRFRLQRLQPEQIRDSILATSERLNRTMEGKTVPLRNRQFVFNHTSVDHTKYDSLRRAIYLPVIRNNLYTLFSQFDFPDPTMPTGSRSSTVVAPQTLLLMNSELVMTSADHLADQLLDQSASDSSRVEQAYQRVLGRKPTDRETNRALAFIDRVASCALTDASTAEPSEVAKAWSLLCQSLYASNEFMYVR